MAGVGIGNIYNSLKNGEKISFKDIALTIGGAAIACFSGKTMVSDMRQMLGISNKVDRTVKVGNADISHEPVPSEKKILEAAESGRVARGGNAANNQLLLEASNKTNPWMEGTEIVAYPAPKDCYINMAMAPNQHYPGFWGTFDEIPNSNYVRNDLAVTPEFKKKVDSVQTYLVPEGTQIQVGTVGPQEYNGIFYPGGGNQVQILNPSDKQRLIPIGAPVKIY